MVGTAWYGIFDADYETDEPAFFDGDYSWRTLLKERFPAIRAALLPLMNERNAALTPYFDARVQYPPGNWRSIPFYFWGVENRKGLALVPDLAPLLADIPELVSASLSMLEPNSEILPHRGETNTAFRVHLAIEVPGGLPECGFRVKEESRPWQEGDVLVFLDSNHHQAFNRTDGRRFVLILDIMRPEFLSQRDAVCRKVLSILSFYWAVTRLPKALLARVSNGGNTRPPRWLLAFLLLPFGALWWLVFPWKRIRGRR